MDVMTLIILVISGWCLCRQEGICGEGGGSNRAVIPNSFEQL